MIALRLKTAVRAVGGREQAAARSGVSIRTLGRVLAGHPIKRATLLELAAALHVPPSWLIDGEGNFSETWVNPRPLGPLPDGTTRAVGPYMPFPTPAPARQVDAPQAPYHVTRIDAAILARILDLLDMLHLDEPNEVRARRIARAYDEATLPADQLPPLPFHTPREDQK